MANNERNLFLLKKAQKGDKTALEQIFAENVGLVKSVAIRFCGRGQETEDLIQIGNIGMLKAIRRFDADLGFAFSTYAVHSISGELKRFLRDDGLIKVSRTLKQKSAIIKRISDDFEAKNGRAARISELSELCGMSAEEITEALEATFPVVSLCAKAGDDEDSPTLEELEGEDHSDEIDEKLALDEAIKTLSVEDQKLVSLRYFHGLTQTECAKMLGMTQVRVSRREKKIMESLRSKLTCEG